MLGWGRVRLWLSWGFNNSLECHDCYDGLLFKKATMFILALTILTDTDGKKDSVKA